MSLVFQHLRSFRSRLSNGPLSINGHRDRRCAVSSTAEQGAWLGVQTVAVIGLHRTRVDACVVISPSAA